MNLLDALKHSNSYEVWMKWHSWPTYFYSNFVRRPEGDFGEHKFRLIKFGLNLFETFRTWFLQDSLFSSSDRLGSMFKTNLMEIYFF